MQYTEEEMEHFQRFKNREAQLNDKHKVDSELLKT